MDGPFENQAEEIKRLQRCMNDLVSLLALPALWSGGNAFQIVGTLLDVLLVMLRLDFVYAQLKDPVSGTPIEMVRVAPSRKLPSRPREIGDVLNHRLGTDPKQWPPLARESMGGRDISIVPFRLGLEEVGVIVAGSERADFPRQAESLFLSVAVSEAAIGLHQARLLNEQKPDAPKLAQRFAQRTGELAASDEELKKEIAERRLVEEQLNQKEKELKRSETRKAAILDSALDCIVMIDHEGYITEFNPAAERTFGFRRDDVLGAKLEDIIVPPSLREKHQQGLAHYLATGEASMLGKRIEMTAVRADGSEIPIEVAITRISLDGPPSFTGYLRDITSRKQAEEKLRRTAAFLAEAQHLSSTGSFSWRVVNDEITWSEQLYSIFEFDQTMPVTLERIISRVHPEDVPSWYEMIDRVRADSSDFEHEHRLQMADRSVKHLHMVAHATRDKEGRREYIGAVRDVTQRRISEEALSDARSELARVARVTSLGALTASIAHEVNQPLSGIITNASTCLRMLAADPPNIDGARETARRTIRDGNRASEVITRLRALFAKRNVTIESVDLNEATREVIALSVSELQRNRVILRSELADNLPPVTGDRIQLQQVILNLLRNASEAMGRVDDRPRQLTITTERDEGDRVRLSVQDSGAGFEPQGVDRLFEAFYTTKSGGMGIGLSVSRSIIESHHGHLWAAPNKGPGATFAFSIPGRSEGGRAPTVLAPLRRL